MDIILKLGMILSMGSPPKADAHPTENFNST